MKLLPRPSAPPARFLASLLSSIRAPVEMERPTTHKTKRGESSIRCRCYYSTCEGTLIRALPLCSARGTAAVKSHPHPGSIRARGMLKQHNLSSAFLASFRVCGVVAVSETGLSEWMGLITYCAISVLEPRCTKNLPQIDSGEQFGRSAVKLSNERLCSYT